MHAFTCASVCTCRLQWMNIHNFELLQYMFLSSNNILMRILQMTLFQLHFDTNNALNEQNTFMYTWSDLAKIYFHLWLCSISQ